MIFILAGSIVANIYMHEQAHVEVFKDDGIKSNVTYTWWGGYTTPERACVTESCRIGNNMNEAVGYNLQSIEILLSGWFIVWVFFKLTEDDE